MAFQVCVVCGRGSTRPTWNNQIGSFVACDFHDTNEINFAVANATTPVVTLQIADPAVADSPQG